MTGSDAATALSLATPRTLATGLDHPEGVAVGLDGAPYAGGEAGQFYRVDPESGITEELASTGGSLLGLCLDAAGLVYACDIRLNALVRLDPRSGEIDIYCEHAEGTRLTAPNWPAFAPDGSLFVSDSGEATIERRTGRLLRIPPGRGDAEVVDLPPLHFPNGLCVGQDGAVYLLESFTPRLSALRNGSLETIAELPGVVPDGLAIDADGGFVVSCYYPFRLLYVSPAGTVETLLDDPLGLHLAMPTNTAFYGDQRRSIAIAQFGHHHHDD